MPITAAVIVRLAARQARSYGWPATTSRYEGDKTKNRPEMAKTACQDKKVPGLVEAKHSWRRIGPARGIDYSAYGVEQPPTSNHFSPPGGTVSSSGTTAMATSHPVIT